MRARVHTRAQIQRERERERERERPDGAVAKSLANGLVGTAFASRVLKDPMDP